jgi:GGDEF domain-containing protein
MASGRAVFILYIKKRGAIAELVTIIEEIEVRYFSELAELRDVVLSDDQWSHQDPTKTLDQWLLLKSRTTALLDEVDGKTSKQIRVIASQVEAQGFRNLVIDRAIVLVCLLIGLAVISVLGKKRHLATHDALTGLPNRMQFEGLLQQDINGGKNVRV